MLPSGGSGRLRQLPARRGICHGVAVGPISGYNTIPLRLGWYLDWQAHAHPYRPGGIEYVQMVRLKGGALRPDVETLAVIAQTNPGSLWLIGNEPDVKWQDNTDPSTYARLYHEAYTAIKLADPTARVAIGGGSQPTPLRLRYLDAVLAAYREQFGTEMPIDVWNVHNFILREERASWGVDIPPSLPDDRGMLYEIEDSGNLEAFQRQIWDFRRWMVERGYGGWPLIVSEYGIPMPEDYGFPPERVVAFLRGTFEFFLTAADPALGDPLDGYRLVQRWCWYSLDDVTYPTGRLFDPQIGALTAVGEGWVEYVSALRYP
ncbi:MAG: glycosyl hydrolase [Anaerolineae bacterium]|nr:glycosyl hydrolase [Anaerolineae bacterium]